MEYISFNSLVEKTLGTRLPNSLADNISFPQLSTEARGVILRMLALMKRSSCPATEFNPLMIWLLSTVTPGMLPSAWGERIPPITAPGRHRKLDAYVTSQTWPSGNGQPVFIDLGCGFPPLTTVDTAKCIPGWLVFGVDRSFASHVLYDAEGHYACFDGAGKFQYFQSPTKPLHENPKAARDRFESLFEDLSTELKGLDDQSSETVVKGGSRLIYNHVRDFEAENLKFIESDIDDLNLPPAQAIRCMNVLLYFEKSVREKMLSKIGTFLGDGGILISGFNHPFGIYARYAVYKKDSNAIRPSEFGFSLDNLRPLGIGPWLTINDEDEEVEFLADLTGAIRTDRIFWAEFNQRVDELQEKYGICKRGDDGFNHFSKKFLTAPPLVTVEKTAALWQQLDVEGYTEKAVEALRRAGYNAWKNPVSHIAVMPPMTLLHRIRI